MKTLFAVIELDESADLVPVEIKLDELMFKLGNEIKGNLTYQTDIRDVAPCPDCFSISKEHHRFSCLS